MIAASRPTKKPTISGGITEFAFGRYNATGAAGPLNGAHALDEHQRADNAQEHDIAQLHQQLDLAQRPQVVEDKQTQRRANQAAHQQDHPHLEIDRLPPEMRHQARNGRGDDLVGGGCDRDGGWDADEKQQRGDQEATPDAEHPRQDADNAAQPQKQENVH